PVADGEGPAVPLMEYLGLEAVARAAKRPVLVVAEGEDESQYAIRPELIGVIEETASSWQFLQELAGVSTPFTEKVWAEAREGVLAEHQAELDALKAEYEAKIDQLTSNVQSEMATRIRGQLMNLVKLKSVDARSDATVDE
ncbi:MAG: hypothetical protein HUJ31_05640, partial [Pseudomonadales bacterium]|nr:hypothetical protein [Pseudomonadales bacterium]